MGKYKRVFVVVLDSFGIGAMPDAEKFGDRGVDTFAHIAKEMPSLNIPNLVKLGLANLHPRRKIITHKNSLTARCSRTPTYQQLSTVSSTPCQHSLNSKIQWVSTWFCLRLPMVRTP